MHQNFFQKNRPEGSTDPLPIKPTKVDEWDENQVLNKIMHEALDTRRNPTESVKTLSLEFNGNVDSDEIISKTYSQERARRENLRKSKYTVKVFYNNLEVSVFPKIQIDSDFALAPLEQTVVRSVDVPKIVKVQIFESGMIRDRQIAYFSIYLPPANATEKFPLQKVTEFRNQERDQEWIGLCRYTSFWGEDKGTLSKNQKMKDKNTRFLFKIFNYKTFFIEIEFLLTNLFIQKFSKFDNEKRNWRRTCTF